MNDVPDTELLSAYLDGELTADEQVRVEQILAASLEARQLLEELRALGSTLQGLPQDKLDEDLSARVLKVAERRMLLPDKSPGEAGDKPSAGRAAETLSPTDADSIGWLGIPWREISWRGMFSKRALIWSGVIAATAIIIISTSPPPPKTDVAKLDHQPVAPAPVAAENNKGKEVQGKGSSDERRWQAAAGRPLKELTDTGPATSDRPPVSGDNDRAAKVTADQPRVREVESLARSPSKAGLQERAIASADQEVVEKARVEGLRHDARPAEGLAGSAVGGPSVSGVPADKAAAEKNGAATQQAAREMGIQSKYSDENQDRKKYVEVAKDAASTGVMPAENKAPSNEHAQAAVPPIDAIGGNVPAPNTAPVPAAPAASHTMQLELPTARRSADTADSSSPSSIGGGGGRSGARRAPDAVPSGTSDAAKGKFAEASQTTQFAKGAPVGANGSGSLPSPSVTKSEEKSLPSPTARALGGEVNSLPSPFGRGAGREGTSAMKSGAGQIVPAATYVRLDVSALAMEKRVFEGLLADCGLPSEQIATYAARNAPADDQRPSDQAGRGRRGGRGGGGFGGGGGGGGGRGGGGGFGGGMAPKQSNRADNSLGAGGMIPSAPAGSAASGSSNRPPAVSQAGAPASQNSAPGAFDNTVDGQLLPAPPNSQRANDSVGQVAQRDRLAELRQQSTVPFRFEFDVSPDQLARILQQIGEKRDSFSAPKIESANAAPPPSESQVVAFNNINGGVIMNGGSLATGQSLEQPANAGTQSLTLSAATPPAGQDQEKQVKAGAGAAILTPGTIVQPQSAPAAPAPTDSQAQQGAWRAGAAKQHVVFLLNVVDHVPSPAAGALQPPAVAAPDPAKN